MGDFVVALLIFTAGFGVAWSWQGSRADARVGALATQQAKASGDAARQAALNLKAAQDKADRIDKAAAIRTADLDRKLQGTKNALNIATRNRPCLGEPALRLLDQSPGLHAPAGATLAVPFHGGTAGPSADPASDERGNYSTDTQVAQWIAGAGALYERCRGRIRDIREWSEGKYPLGHQ